MHWEESWFIFKIKEFNQNFTDKLQISAVKEWRNAISYDDTLNGRVDSHTHYYVELF